MNEYDEMIFNHQVERTLMDPPPEERTCMMCDEHTIYVDDFNINYRYLAVDIMEDLKPMCMRCYVFYVVTVMDEQWLDYDSSTR